MHIRLKLPKSIFATGFFILILRGLSAVSNFAMVFVLARALGASGYGAFSLGTAFLAVLSVLNRWGLDNVLLKQVSSLSLDNMPLSRGYIIKSSFLVFVFGAVLGSGLFVSSGYISSYFFDNDELHSVLKVISLMLPFYSVTLIVGECLKALSKPGVATFVQSIIFPSITVAGVVCFEKVIEFDAKLSTVVYLISVIIAFVIGVGYLVNKMRVAPFERVRVKSLLRQGVPMLLISSSALLMAWTDIFIIGLLGSSHEVGIYSVVVKVSSVMVVALASVGAVVAPLYAQWYKKGELKKMESTANVTSLMFIVFSLVSIIVVSYWGEEFLVLFGAEYAVGYPLLVLLWFAQCVNISCGSVGYLLTMTGNEKVFQRILMLAAFMNVFLDYFLYEAMGIAGVAVGTSMTIIIWNVAAVVAIKKRLGFWCVANFRVEVLREGRQVLFSR